MTIDTPSTPCYPVCTANVTASSITEPVPTTTEPSGSGVIAWGRGGEVAATALKLIPYGVGSDTNTFNMNVYGWEHYPELQQVGLGLWVPVMLATFTGCELDSGMPGLAGAVLGSTQYFCSDITLALGNSGISVEVVSPGHANNKIAHVVIDAKGARYVEVRFGTGGSATSANALWRRM